MTKRNGKIDFLRFIFAVVIMLHHLGMRSSLFDAFGIHFQVINQGGFAVVFYFLVSGYLLAKSAKKISRDANIPDETTKYIWKKYKSFMVWYIPAFFLYFLGCSMVEGISSGLKQVIYNIPGLLMLKYIGFDGRMQYPNGYFVPASWYLSALMICSLIIYPIILLKREWFIKILAPLTSITCVYVLLNYKDRLRSSSGIWYPLAVMCIGCIMSELSEYIKYNDTLRKYRMALHLIEIGIYSLSLVYICSDLPMQFEYPLFILLSFGVSISFSGITNYRIYDNRIFTFIGKASFPLYILHEAISMIYIEVLKRFGVNHGMKSHIMLYLLCITVAVTAQIVYGSIEKKNRSGGMF